MNTIIIMSIIKTTTTISAVAVSLMIGRKVIGVGNVIIINIL